MTSRRVGRLSGAVIGDVDDLRLLRLDGVEDLDAVASIEAHVWTPCDATANLDVTVVDATERTVYLNLGSAGGWLPEQATRGLWMVEIEVTFGDGTILTWPGGSPMTLPVREDGA